MTITAAADGSALGNPGPMGWAWYIDDDRWAAGGAPHGTNNQGELTAVLELLRATAGSDEVLHIACDSRYVIDSVTKWTPNWKRKGWRKADGKPVLNRDLLEALDAEMAGRQVEFEWVKGHAGHPLNEAADARANAAAVAYQSGAPVASGPGFGATAPDAPTVAPSPSRGDVVPRGDVPPDSSSGTDISSRTRGRSGDAEPAPTLFDDLDDGPVELRLTLTSEEDGRLRARARYEGVSPEELLRRLI